MGVLKGKRRREGSTHGDRGINMPDTKVHFTLNSSNGIGLCDATAPTVNLLIHSLFHSFIVLHKICNPLHNCNPATVMNDEVK